MNILDQAGGENLLNEYQANRKKTFLIFGCYAAAFVCVFIYQYSFYNPSFGRVLLEAVLCVFFVSIIPAAAALQAHFAQKNARSSFLVAFAVQSAVIISAIFVFSLKNIYLTAIYLGTVIFSAIILSIFFIVKSRRTFKPSLDWKEEGLFSAPVIGVLAVFVIGILLLTGWIVIPGPLMWIAAWVVAVGFAALFATIKYRKNMEKALGRKVKGEYELSSFASWMETKEPGSANKNNSNPSNHRLSPMANNPAKISNPNNYPLPNTEKKNKVEELQRESFVRIPESPTKEDIIKLREKLAALVENQRTKGIEEVGNRISNNCEETGVVPKKCEKELDSLSIKGRKSSDENFNNKPIGRILSKSEVAEFFSRLNLEQSLESDKLPAPRDYHYLFAHRYLPLKLSESPQMVVSWLAGEKGTEHLKVRWGLLPTVYQIDTKDYIEPTGLNRYVLRPNEDHTLVIIRFPEPARMTEAYFAAVLFNRKDSSYRYFTLELSFADQSGSTRKTVLGEWVNDKRINHGDGSLPGVESFSSLIIDRFI